MSLTVDPISMITMTKMRQRITVALLGVMKHLRWPLPNNRTRGTCPHLHEDMEEAMAVMKGPAVGLGVAVWPLQNVRDALGQWIKVGGMQTDKHQGGTRSGEKIPGIETVDRGPRKALLPCDIDRWIIDGEDLLIETVTIVVAGMTHQIAEKRTIDEDAAIPRHPDVIGMLLQLHHQ